MTRGEMNHKQHWQLWGAGPGADVPPLPSDAVSVLTASFELEATFKAFFVFDVLLPACGNIVRIFARFRLHRRIGIGCARECMRKQGDGLGGADPKTFPKTWLNSPLGSGP